MNKSFLLVFLITALLFVSCGVENTAGSQGESSSGSAVAVSGSAVSDKAKDEEKREIRYVDENKKYGIALPEPEFFREELEKIIYWVHATEPTKEPDNMYTYLKKNGGLNRDLKVKLCYAESETSYFDEPDEEGRPCYVIFVCFPELREEEEYIPLGSYNARGACKPYEFEFDSGETHSKKQLQKEWKDVDWGETTIYIDEEKAESYLPEEDASEIRKQIEKDCMKEIKDYCGDNADQEIYLYDFLPGDEWIEGKVLNFGTKGGFIPVGHLSVHVCYKGKKMEKYNGISWHVKPSGTGSDSITQEIAREMLEPYKEEMLPEHCFMAYHVKGDQITSLKQE